MFQIKWSGIAIYRGFAYRPLYRYTAWRVVPTRYFCTER